MPKAAKKRWDEKDLTESGRKKFLMVMDKFHGRKLRDKSGALVVDFKAAVKEAFDQGESVSENVLSGKSGF